AAAGSPDSDGPASSERVWRSLKPTDDCPKRRDDAPRDDGAAWRNVVEGAIVQFFPREARVELRSNLDLQARLDLVFAHGDPEGDSRGLPFPEPLPAYQIDPETKPRWDSTRRRALQERGQPIGYLLADLDQLFAPEPCVAERAPGSEADLQLARV